MSLLLGVKNTADQTVAVGGIINLGNVYRKYCKKINCTKAFDFNGNGINLNHSGIYHVTAVAIATSGAAGNVTIQMYENGVLVPGASATDTFATTTQLKTLMIDYYILVDNTSILGQTATLAKNISFAVLETAATISNIVVNVEKVV